MKSSYAPASDHVPRPWRSLSERERARRALLSPRSAVGFSSGEAYAQSLASKVLQALRTAAAVAPLNNPPQPLKGVQERSARIEQSSPFSWARYNFGSLGALRTQLYNQAVDTDAQVRPAAARPCVLVRRSPLR
jgi:hypothetical protein